MYLLRKWTYRSNILLIPDTKAELLLTIVAVVVAMEWLLCWGWSGSGVMLERAYLEASGMMSIDYKGCSSSSPSCLQLSSILSGCLQPASQCDGCWLYLIGEERRR